MTAFLQKSGRRKLGNTTGVLLRDVLAPSLFIIILDLVLKNKAATTGIMTHEDEILLPNLDFTDSLV